MDDFRSGEETAQMEGVDPKTPERDRWIDRTRRDNCDEARGRQKTKRHGQRGRHPLAHRPARPQKRHFLLATVSVSQEKGTCLKEQSGFLPCFHVAKVWSSRLGHLLCHTSLSPMTCTKDFKLLKHSRVFFHFLSEGGTTRVFEGGRRIVHDPDPRRI